MSSNLPDNEERDNEEQTPSRQVAVGRNIVQVIGERARAILIQAPGLGYAGGALAVVILIVGVLVVLRGLDVRVEQLFPTPTPWALPAAAKPREVLVMVAKFERIGGVADTDPSGRIIEALQQSLPNDLASSVRFFEIPQAYSRGQLTEVRALGQRVNATMVIWGAYDAAGTTVHFSIIPDKEFALRNASLQLGPPIDQPTEFDLFFSQKLPSEAVFFTDFTIGQLYYWNDNYAQALRLYSTALQNGEEGQADNNSLALAYLNRGIAELFPPVQQWATAATDFQNALNKNGELVPAYNNLGFAKRLLGATDEARQAHLKALDLLSQQPSEIESARASLGLGDVNYYASTYSDALAKYQEAEALYKQVGDTDGEISAQLGMAKAYIGLSDYQLAYKTSSAVRDAAVAAGKLDEQGDALISIGDSYYYQTDLKNSEDAYNAALQLFLRVGDRRGQANALSSIGDVRSLQNRYDDAVALYRQAMSIRAALGEKLGQAGILSSIAEIEREQSSYDAASRDYAQAQALYQSLGDTGGLATSYLDVGNLDSSEGKFDLAGQSYEKAIELGKQLGENVLVANCYQSLSELKITAGDADSAISYANQAIKLFQGLHQNNGLMNSYWTLAEGEIIKAQGGDASVVADAKANANRSLELAKQIGSKLAEANALTVLSQADTLSGDYDSAIRNGQDALQMNKDLNIPLNVASNDMVIGEAQMQKNAYKEAEPYLTDGLKIFTQLGNDYGKAGIMNDLAYTYAELGTNLKDAETMAKQAVDYFKTSPIYEGACLDTLGWVYYKERRLQLAKTTIEQAYKLLPIPSIKDHLDAVTGKTGG